MADEKLTHADGCALAQEYRELAEAVAHDTATRPLVSLGQCTCYLDRVVELEAEVARLNAGHRCDEIMAIGKCLDCSGHCDEGGET